MVINELSQPNDVDKGEKTEIDIELPVEINDDAHYVPPFGILADILHRSYNTYINRSFKDYKLNYSHISLLIEIYLNKGISQENIANKLKIDKGSVAKGFRKLEEGKYIIRVRDKKDRRKYTLNLTDSGEEMVKRAIKVNAEWEEKVLDSLNSEQFKNNFKKATNIATGLL